MNRPPYKIITERNVTGMRQCNPSSIYVRESAKLIMIAALVVIVSFMLLVREGM